MPFSFQAMSEEHLKAFLEAVKADVSLQDKLKTATEKSTVVAIAKEAGFEIAIETIKKHTERDAYLYEEVLWSHLVELSDEETMR